MSEITFYYGVASGSSRKALKKLEEPNIMINYATARNKPWNGIEKLFIDSGGYSFMLGKGDYGTTDSEYLKFIEKFQPNLFALRDYPCEPSVLKKNDKSVTEHLEATTRRHKNLLRLLPKFDIEAQPVCVIQGWKLRDYHRHLDMLIEEDVLTDYVAVGSVCRRNQDEEIKRIISELSERIGDRKLHAFGVKSNILRFQEMREKLDSADSMAYEMGERFGSRVSGTESKSFRDSALSYLEFKKKINQLINRESGKNQKSLGVYT